MNKKRLIAFLLTVVICITMMVTTCFAATTYQNYFIGAGDSNWNGKSEGELAYLSDGLGNWAVGVSGSSPGSVSTAKLYYVVVLGADVKIASLTSISIGYEKRISNLVFRSNRSYYSVLKTQSDYGAFGVIKYEQ